MSNKAIYGDPLVSTGVCYASWINILKPVENDKGTFWYSMDLIIPKSDTETVGEINSAIDQILEQKEWKRSGSLRIPLKDCTSQGTESMLNTPEKEEFYKDKYLLRVKTLDKFPPTVIHQDDNRLVKEHEITATGKVMVNLNSVYAYEGVADNKVPYKGVGFGFNQVLWLGEDEEFKNVTFGSSDSTPKEAKKTSSASFKRFNNVDVSPEDDIPF